jgi:hypothetical protein
MLLKDKPVKGKPVKKTKFQKVEASVYLDILIKELSEGEVSDEMYCQIGKLLLGHPVVMIEDEENLKFEIQWGKR